MNKKIQKKLTWLSLFSIIIWVFCPSEAYASRNTQGSNTHSFSVAENPYKYSSYYLDSESGMYYLKARYYSSELMRFISRDTYDLSNRYAYCSGNPVEKVDPSGHLDMDWKFLVNFASMAVGACMICGGIYDAVRATEVAGRTTIGAARSALIKRVSSRNKVSIQTREALDSSKEFKTMSRDELKDYMGVNGKYLGKGAEGMVYKYGDCAYKFFSSDPKEKAERSARLINSFTLNQDAGFEATLAANDSSVLVTPVVDMSTKANELELTEIFQRLAKEDNRFFADCKSTNIGMFKGHGVVFDPGFCVDPRSSSFDSKGLIELIKKAKKSDPMLYSVKNKYEKLVKNFYLFE